MSGEHTVNYYERVKAKPEYHWEVAFIELAEGLLHLHGVDESMVSQTELDDLVRETLAELKEGLKKVGN